MTSVTFGGQGTAFTVVDDSTITATAPASDSWAGDSVGVDGIVGGWHQHGDPGRPLHLHGGIGGGGGSTSCAKVTGIGDLHPLSGCSPAVTGEAKAIDPGLGSGTLTWSSDGATTDIAVTVSSPGQGACATGSTEEDVSGTVVGGSSLRAPSGTRCRGRSARRPRARCRWCRAARPASDRPLKPPAGAGSPPARRRRRAPGPVRSSPPASRPMSAGTCAGGRPAPDRTAEEDP